MLIWIQFDDFMDRIYRQYEARLKPGSMTGHEVEMPLVMKKTGLQPALEDVSSMLLAIQKIERGWEPKFEPLIINGKQSTEHCTSVVRKIDGFADEVTTDMAIGTMEVVLGPEKDLSANERKLRRRLSVIMEAAERSGIEMLGLGIQPFQGRSFDNVMPKSRYLYLVEHFGDDLIDMTVTAAAQVHVDVSRENAVSTLNTMVGFSPAIIALTANSTILEDDIDNRQEFRGTAWSIMTRNKIIEEERVGTPNRFASIEDWFVRIIGFKPILIARDNDYLHFERNNPDSFSSFMGRKESTVLTVGSNRQVIVNPKIEDFMILLGSIWTDARLTRYGTVEMRAPPCQPSVKDLMAINALVLGLRNNSYEAEAYLKKFSDSEIKEARVDAIYNGLDSNIGDIPIKEVSDNMLRIAARGLESQHLHYLQPMRNTLEEGVNHAVKSRRRFLELKNMNSCREEFLDVFIRAHRFDIS